MEFDVDELSAGSDDEDSPYPEVRASVSNIDDAEMPTTTLRMWAISLLLSLIAGSANTFFAFRQPSPFISPPVLLLVSHPVGKCLALLVPIGAWRVRVPALGDWAARVAERAWGALRCWGRAKGKDKRRDEGAEAGEDAGEGEGDEDKGAGEEDEQRARRGLGLEWVVWEFSLNPGPWNIKEHALVYLMANVTVGSPFALTAVVVAEQNYNIHYSWWFSLLFMLTTQLSGFGLAGLCRRFLIWPASMVWPQNLVTCTVLNTLHAEEDEGRGGITRYKFFIWAGLGAFFWFFLPGTSPAPSLPTTN